MSSRARPTAIILVAGQGRRLLPFTKNIPKCLLKVGRLPIIHRQIRALAECGIKDVIMVVGFRREVIESYVLEKFPNLRFIFIPNPLLQTNTLYSLALAAERIKSRGPVFQLNGDVVFDSKIIEMFTKAETEKSYVAVRPGACGQEEMKVVLSKDGSIARLNKKIKNKPILGEAVGLNKFSPYFWRKLASNLREMKNDFRQEYFECAIEKTIREGAKIFPLNIKRLAAIEIDFPRDLKRARQIFDSR